MKGYCSWSVGMVYVCVCLHVFSRNVAVGIPNVDMCNVRSAQQESGAALSKNSTYVSRQLLYKVYSASLTQHTQGKGQPVKQCSQNERH